MNALIQVIKWLSFASAVPAIWLGRRLRSVLWYYAWASFGCDMLGLVVHQVMGSNSRFSGNLFGMLELLLIGIYFSYELFSGSIRKASLAIIAALILFGLYRIRVAAFEGNDWQFHAITHMVFVVYCIIALVKVIKNVEHVKLEQSPLFVFSAAFLLYASYSCVVMLFADYFREAPVMVRQQLWSIHNVLNVVKNLAIARVFYLKQKAPAR